MITYEDKSFNSWQDVVKDYPAMWVVFDKAELTHGQIQSGSIMAILPDEEIINFRNTHLGEVKLSLRTTETVRMNIDLSALLASRGINEVGDGGDVGNGVGSVAGVGTLAGAGADSGAGVAVGSVGGYIHGELIDA